MLCCVCLLKQPKTFGVFNNSHTAHNIAEIIQQHFWFKPTPSDDDDSTQICELCWNKIKDFHDFYQMVEKSHNAEIKLEEEKPYSTSAIKQEQDAFEENLMQVEVEIDVNSSGDQQVEVIKENPLEAKKVDDIESDQDFEDDSNDSSFNCENSDLNEGGESSAEEVNTKNTNCKKGNSEKKENKVRESKKITKKKSNNAKTKKKWTDKFLDPVLTEEMIKKHINMICDLCVFVGTSFPDMVTHFKKYHPKVRPYIMCCERKFTKRYYVAQHALKHEDPNYFRCEQCNKSFTTTCSLRTHNLSYHAPEEELLHTCESCPRKFARRNLLELHRPVHIPKEDWTFFCTKCPTQKALVKIKY